MDFNLIGIAQSKAYNIKLKGYFALQPSVSTEASYTITIVNPCFSKVANFPTIPAGGYNLILTDTSTQTIDWSSELTFTPSICPSEAELKMDNSAIATTLPFVSFTPSTKTMVLAPTSDFTLLGGFVETKTYTVRLNYKYSQYGNIDPSPLS